MKSLRPALAFLSVLSIILFFACQKEIHPPVTIDFPEHNETVAFDVEGRITASGEPVAGAMVHAGQRTAITDIDGNFFITDVNLPWQTAFVTVEKAGYFTGSRTFVATEGETSYLEIGLIEQKVTATFATDTRSIIFLPPQSTVGPSQPSVMFDHTEFIRQSDSTPYSGNVEIRMHYLNPSADDLSLEMPGDLRGIDTAGNLTGMITYGMMAVELQSPSGEKLQVAPASKAQLMFPISPTQSATAPATIPLWYFDETDGLWKEDGNAVKDGNFYVGEVDHFSFWNVDVPEEFVYLSVELNDQGGNAVPYTNVYLSIPDGASTYGQTDNNGIAKGWVPKNKSLTMEVKDKCGNILLTENVGPFSSSKNLGIKRLNIPGNLSVTVSGTALDCNGDLLEEGFATIELEGRVFRTDIEAGIFSLTLSRCNATPAELTITAVDNSSAPFVSSEPMVISDVTNGTLTPVELEVCGNTVEEYIRVVVDGDKYDFIAPQDSITLEINNRGHGFSAKSRFPDDTFMGFFCEGDPGPGNFTLRSFVLESASHSFRFGTNTPGGVTITKYEKPGFIEGSIEGQAYTDSNRVNTIPYSTTFRIKNQ